MQVSIRDFTQEDAPRIKELIQAYNQFFETIDPWKALQYGDNAVEFYFQQMVALTNDRGKFFVAVVDGSIVGFIQGHIHKPTESERMERGDFLSGDIDNLFILEKFRAAGIGKLLMKRMEAFFVTQGCTSIALNVFAPNIHAQEFYKNLGFSPRAIIMVKRLMTH